MEVRIESGWKEKLENEFDKPYFCKLTEYIRREYTFKTIYPPGHLIFNAFNLTPFENVKAVIIGQDPYHGSGQAHGLCFSVPDGVKLPPSLKNIYKEIENDLSIKPLSSGNLGRWANQGILLLNSTLTVVDGLAGSHQKRGWEEFTNAVISILNRDKENLVFFLWGAYAQRKGEVIDREKHLVLESVHPSPVSASRGFFGNHHFSRCNEYLSLKEKKIIDWK